ncbi:MAG: hypothetical protein DHS20C16_18870 [Phycisphaerae bacterium]|nr:MAG: hypothetical protein DHS20C16_18870 [Phycisphaerae bacterium]
MFGWDEQKLLSISYWELDGAANAKSCVYQINRHAFAKRFVPERVESQEV